MTLAIELDARGRRFRAALAAALVGDKATAPHRRELRSSRRR